MATSRFAALSILLSGLTSSRMAIGFSLHAFDIAVRAAARPVIVNAAVLDN